MVDHGGKLKTQTLPEGGGSLHEDIVLIERREDDFSLQGPGLAYLDMPHTTKVKAEPSMLCLT
jgi:hypothetical protein